MDVYSSVPGGGYDGSYSGTSMAGPHVAGVVALMRQANPNLDVDTIKQILMDTARDEGTAGEDNTYGWGIDRRLRRGHRGHGRLRHDRGHRPQQQLEQLSVSRARGEAPRDRQHLDDGRGWLLPSVRCCRNLRDRGEHPSFRPDTAG